MKFVRLAVALCVGLAPACNKPAAPVTTPTTATAKPLTVAPGGGPTPTPPDPAKSGETFLAALRDRKLTPAMLTPEFKAVLAPAGSGSDWAVGNWLGSFHTDIQNRAAYPLDANSTLVFGISMGAFNPQTSTYCKLVTPPGAAEPLVAWLHASPARPAVDLSTDTAPKFTAVAFVDTLLTKQTPLAVSLLAPAALKRLAPPLDDDDAKLGYNRGLLSLKLGGFRESFTSVTYGAATKAGANLTLAGELTGPGTERRKFTVTVAPAGAGWLVEDFRHD